MINYIMDLKISHYYKLPVDYCENTIRWRHTHWLANTHTHRGTSCGVRRIALCMLSECATTLCFAVQCSAVDRQLVEFSQHTYL